MGKNEWMCDFLQSLDVIERELHSLCGKCGGGKPPHPPNCRPSGGELTHKPPCRPDKPPPGFKPPCGRKRFCCDRE